MKTKFKMFRRENGVYYSEDTTTGKQASLHTKDETEALSLLHAKNEAQRQPVLNLHLARAYLTASDPAFVERTWSVVMAQLQARGKESSRERFATAFKSPALNNLRQKKLLETTADDFFAVFRIAKPSTICFLHRLHHLALSAGWIALPIVAPNLWPKYKPKDRRGITQAEHESLLAKETKAEWRLYLELLWETGAAQADAASFKAEDVGTRHKVAVTTNFDYLLSDALLMFAGTHPFICVHELLARYITDDMRCPLIAKLHRDLMLAPMNNPEEISELARQWKIPLGKLFKRYTPIVIGFGDTGGGGGSLKRFLEGLKSIPGGIYWCYVEEKPGVPPSKEVETIVRRLKGRLVPIKGFDEIMHDLRNLLH